MPSLDVPTEDGPMTPTLDEALAKQQEQPVPRRGRILPRLAVAGVLLAIIALLTVDTARVSSLSKSDTEKSDTIKQLATSLTTLAGIGLQLFLALRLRPIAGFLRVAPSPAGIWHSVR